MKTTPAVLLLLCGSLACGFAIQEPGANTRALRDSATTMAAIDLTDARGSSNAHAARFTEAGELIRPLGWRKWVYVGTPLTPHDMNQNKAAFPEFHNVYVDPESFATFERTGEWRDGTQLVKELVLVGSKSAVSGNGYFMGDFAGLEVAVKDSQRFPNEPGNWAYFSFGHKAEYEQTAKAFPTASCNSCHEASANTDFVFTQYYPVLREAMPMKKRMEMDSDRQSSKSMDAASMQAAMQAMGAATDQQASADQYARKVFQWLAAKNYRNFKAESAIHPSSSGPAVHGDVKVFVNDKLDASMLAGNRVHPVGSMSVKELYKDGTLIGWALALKTKEDDGRGNGWYWYENVSTTDFSNPVAASLGNSMCVGCHAPGNDFMLTRQIK